MSDLLHEIIDQLVDRFGAHETTQALLDNEKWQKHALEPNEDKEFPYWRFLHRWRTSMTTWEQHWIIAPNPEPTIFGQSDLQRPVG